jgi:WD40 repeat protein
MYMQQKARMILRLRISLLAKSLLLFAITAITSKGPLGPAFAKSKDSALDRPQLVAERGHLSWISDCSFVRGDRDIITAGGGDQTAVLWDAATGRELRRLRGHTAQVLTIAPHPSLPQVLTGSVDTTVRLWNLGTGRNSCVQRAPGRCHRGRIYPNRRKVFHDWLGRGPAVELLPDLPPQQ